MQEEQTKKCPQCGEEILKVAKKCKHCGTKVKKSFVKQLFRIVITGFIFIIIISVLFGGSDKNGTDKIQEKTLKSYSINQDVMISDVRWRLINAKNRGNILKSSESRYPTIAKDKTTTGKFIEIIIEVENLSNEMKSVTSLKLIDSKNREFISASDTSEWIPREKELFLLSNLNPNIPQQFADIYEVPTDATGLKVKVGDLSLWGDEESLIDLNL